MKNDTQPSRLRCACMCARRKSWLMPMKMPSRMPAIASRMAVRKNKDGIDMTQPSMRMVMNRYRPYAGRARGRCDLGHTGSARQTIGFNASGSTVGGGPAGCEHDDREQHE